MLGGSAQQVPAIKKAKELGFRTVLIDYLPDCPGQFVADKWYEESTTDIAAVERIAREEKVDGILPYASDPAALPAAIVAERLGLPTNPAKSVEILGVKHKFRQFLQENGFPCPHCFTFSATESIEEIKHKAEMLTFPIVIKPTDSSGSKGVSFLKDTARIEEAIKGADQYSHNKILIAEEFIERGYPYVIGGDIFIENGEIALYGDMECLRGNNGKSLIPIGKKKPNGLSNKQSKLLRAELQRLVSALNIKLGEMNIELLIDSNDMPHFLELGPRAGGNMIPIQLSDAFGIDLIEANVLAALGIAVELKPQNKEGAYMTYVLHSGKAGKFKGIQISNEIGQYIYRKVIYKEDGDDVEVFDGAGKAIGILFFHFADKATMDSFEPVLEDHIKVLLK